MTSIPLSVLDLAFITEGLTAGAALRNARDLARHAEAWGYRRFWLAEHHNAPGVASAATAVAIGFVAEGTSTIRVGSGGVMLPNHAPLVVAEQFGTLESLYPGRIDLGVGRAPGTDQETVGALRRRAAAAETFPEDVADLAHFLADPAPGQRVRAVPGSGSNVPLWILGSSVNGATVAAALGLPFAFAAHFAPGQLTAALAVYREQFRPSNQLGAPYTMVSTNAIVAGTDSEAHHLFSGYQQYMTENMFRGAQGMLPPPTEHIDGFWTTAEKQQISYMLSRSLVGSARTVESQLLELWSETAADELIVSAVNHDHDGRLLTYRALAEVAARLPETAVAPS